MDDLFKKHQKTLLSFANTDFGKQFISDKFGQKINNYDQVVKITPNSFYIQKDKGIYQAVFFPKDVYTKKFGLALTKCDIASDYLNFYTHSKREFVLPYYLGLSKANFGFPVIMTIETTFNPNANPESTSVDGEVGFDGTSSWADTIVGQQAGSFESQDSTTNGIICDAANTGGSPIHYICRRGFFLFDTSSLTSSATDVSGVMSVYVTLKYDTDGGGGNVNVYSSSPASNTALVNNDYNQVGTTAFASDLDITNISLNAYSDFTFNATGNSNISLSGISKFSIRETVHDVGALAPTTPGDERIDGNFADNGSNIPKLVVTYTPGSNMDLNSKMW